MTLTLRPLGSRRSKLYEWRITRITAHAFIGYVVEAPDPETAIKEAIRRYGITEPWEQDRLVAEKWLRHVQAGINGTLRRSAELGNWPEARQKSNPDHLRSGPRCQ